jgi:hypothetical protein
MQNRFVHLRILGVVVNLIRFVHLRILGDLFIFGRFNFFKFKMFHAVCPAKFRSDLGIFGGFATRLETYIIICIQIPRRHSTYPKSNQTT